MTLVRNSPAHLEAVARIDMTYYHRLRELRERFLGDNDGITESELEECPEWQTFSAALKAEWAEALAELRGRVSSAC